MAPVGCAVAPPISGLLSIEGIPFEGLVDTGASITCLGFAIWWRYRAQWGALKPFTNAVHGAHGKPLQIAGRTEHLDIQWGEGTATPAQPDPQTIHLNAAQAQPRQKKLLPRPVPSPPLPQEAAVVEAPLPAPREAPPPSVSAPGQVANRGRERDSL